MTQSELAEQMGVSQPTVWEWVHGESIPTVERLIKISKITGISIDDLVKQEVA